mgnify:CR=1 FL=1
MTLDLSIDHALIKARAYAKKGEFNEAQTLYHAILSNFPNNKRAKQGLADLNKFKKKSGQIFVNEEIQKLLDLFNKGQFLLVLKQAQTLSKQYPQEFVIWNIMGAAYASLKEFNNAVIALEKVIELNPNYVDAYYNIGVVLNDQGKIQEAIEAYKKCISLFPNYPDAYVNLGLALRAQGNIENSIEAFLTALKLKPDHPEALFNIGISLKGTFFKKPHPNLQKVISTLIDKKTYVRPNDIINASISLLKFEPQLNTHLDKEDLSSSDFNHQEIIRDLSNLPLLLKLMSVCPISDIHLEKLLEKIRTKLLMSINASVHTFEELKFQSALALQCFTNEYVYNQNSEDFKSIKKLETLVEIDFRKGNQPNPNALLCLASFKSLSEYDWCELVDVTKNLEEVFIRQVLERKEEECLKSEIKTLGVIKDEISSKVRRQYEDSPYPRWINLGLIKEPIYIRELADRFRLKLTSPIIKKVQAPSILIAGCGTGQHSIQTAARFKNSKVSAIDLSLSSLAYAKRKTKELGMRNIEYLQADLLDLEKLGSKFDLIECVGVLHHMRDPLKGWKVLTKCLKPGGLMKIGLYSKLARKSVADFRKSINPTKEPLSNKKIKSIRNKIINSTNKEHNYIKSWHDFYSSSEIRDLLFNVQEHRFTLPQIKSCLIDLGLTFCGFQGLYIQNSFLRSYNDSDLYDLMQWDLFEKSNPRIFAGMYQFWCQKS